MPMPPLSAHVLLLAASSLMVAGVVPPTPTDLLKPAAGAQTTASGLASLAMAPGQGSEHPGAKDFVRMHYTIWTAEGRLVDSTVARDEPVTLAVDHLMPGMAEGLRLMAPGERRRVWVPAALGFPAGKGLPTGALVMDLELIVMDPPPSQPPAALLTPDPEARVTGSGLAYLPLRHGTGTQHPGTRDRVMVQYTGWTTDGKAFDSSLPRRGGVSFKLDEVISGWTQGLKLMVVGDKTRFWVPEKLAYRGQEGMPKGTLVFDVELLKIWP